MAQISKRPLGAEVRREMFQAFFRALAKISDEAAMAKILDDIFTPTEKVMIAKRVMAAILLDRGYPYHKIGEFLKMSPTTINTVQREIRKKGEGYRLIFSLFPKRSKVDDIFEAADRLLARMIPPIKGSRSSLHRWKRS